MMAVVLIGLFYNKDWYNRGFIKWVVLGLTIFALITPDLTQYIPDILGDRSLGEYEDSRLAQMAIDNTTDSSAGQALIVLIMTAPFMISSLVQLRKEFKQQAAKQAQAMQAQNFQAQNYQA